MQGATQWGEAAAQQVGKARLACTASDGQLTAGSAPRLQVGSTWLNRWHPQRKECACVEVVEVVVALSATRASQRCKENKAVRGERKKGGRLQGRCQLFWLRGSRHGSAHGLPREQGQAAPCWSAFPPLRAAAAAGIGSGNGLVQGLTAQRRDTHHQHVASLGWAQPQHDTQPVAPACPHFPQQRVVVHVLPSKSVVSRPQDTGRCGGGHGQPSGGGAVAGHLFEAGAACCHDVIVAVVAAHVPPQRQGQCRRAHAVGVWPVGERCQEAVEHAAHCAARCKRAS